MSDSRNDCSSVSHGDGGASDLRGKLLRVAERAAGNHERADALSLEVGRGELSHFAGADDKHLAALQIAEDLFAQGSPPQS